MAATRTHFISIRWKAIIAFSLVLILVNFGLSWQASQALKQQFSQHQQSLQLQHRQQLDGLLSGNFESLTQNAYIIHDNLVIGSQPASPESIAKQRDALLDVYDLLGLELLIPGSVADQERELPAAMRFAMKQAYQNEQVGEGVYCDTQCSLYVMVPVIQPDKSIAVLLLRKSVAQLMAGFFAVSTQDIGLVDYQRQLVYAASNATHQLPLIEALLDSVNLAQMPDRYRWQNREYALQYLPLIPHRDGQQFIILSDITDSLAQIAQSSRQSLQFGLLGLALSLLVLLYLLAKPLARIVNLSQHLPLLANKQHDQFKERFTEKTQLPQVGDELDQLEAISLELADQLKASEEVLTWRADHDELTGLKNRRSFNQDFEQVLRNAIRYRHEGALLYFDLDKFKYINDTSGHKSGDNLLRHVSKALQKIIRKSDVIARLGGDEFAMILSETDALGALNMAKKIQETLANIELLEGDTVHRTSASIGIVLFPVAYDDIEEADMADQVQDLVASGDIAMYQAKEKGGGQAHLFAETDQTRERYAQRLKWHDDIKLAINEKRLLLYFQPIVDLQTQAISHYEVLLRLQQQDGKIILPSAFIAEAEHSGLITDIDFYVIEQTMGYLQDHPGFEGQLAINLSGKSISKAGLSNHIQRHLVQTRINASRLVFEVTETAAVADIQLASQIMHRINQLGCRFALDDFGSGYSSFYYLKELPVDYLKIDGMFVRNLASNEDDQRFVKAIAQVISGLGKKTIAEFVENRETYEMLKDFGVDYGQGYYFAHPKPSPKK